jgi:chromosome segregation ATPase
MRRSSIPRRQHEQILADTQQRHQQALDQVNAQLADAKARIDAVSVDRERLRAERDQFEKDRNAYRDASPETSPVVFDVSTVEATAEEMAVWEARVAAHLAWRRPADDEKRPVDGGSWRPTHPATDLKRALERCRALQAVLDGRGTRVAP